MTTRALLARRIDESVAAVESLRGQVDLLAEISERMVQALRSGGTVYTAGNGGSAAEALHLAEELIGRYRDDRPPQRAVCLNADPTSLTCIANDYGYENVFARQCEALLRPGDVLLVLSTSGRSPNIIRALETCRAKGAFSAALLAGDGGPAASLCDIAVVVPTSDSAHAQEAHQVVIHLICEAVEQDAIGGRRTDASK